MADLIPREILFGNPERSNPRLSPDGKAIAWIAPSEGVLNLWSARLNSATGFDPDAAQVLTSDKDRGIAAFEWAHDNRHLLYLQDAGGDENWRLHDVDLATLEHRDLTPFDGVQTQIIASSPDFPDELLIGLNKDNRQLHDVYRLRLGTGELTMETENPGVVGWAADSGLVARAGLAPHPDGSYTLLVRESAGDEWRSLMAVPPEDAITVKIVGFSLDGTRVLLISSAGAQTARLVSVDLATGAAEVLAEDPAADVRAVRLDPRSKRPQFATVVKARSEYIAVDQSVAADLAAVGALSPGDPAVVSADDADSRWLVEFTLDAGPARYFLYDRAAKAGVLLFEHQPALSGYQLAATEPFSFTARDGLTIHGYVTFPVGLPRAGLPAVLNVHGGPWSRDVWGYAPHVQWLANRGYACVQVNFRGSAGYGKPFLNAGDREWGAKMQDDLSDAVAYVVSQCWVDPARVGICGASYGGYAALVGAAFTPDLYRCAIDIVGPANLKTAIEGIPAYWAPAVRQLFNRRVGDPATEAELLWSRSPLSRADQIKIPLLIAHGANDPRVRQSESEQIAAALEAAGVDHEYLLFPDEGHGIKKPENRETLYAAAERFLARHLGGRCQD